MAAMATLLGGNISYCVVYWNWGACLCQRRVRRDEVTREGVLFVYYVHVFLDAVIERQKIHGCLNTLFLF